MSRIVSDYHMHTPLCGHAVGLPSQYVEHAIKIGLKEMGFSDHAPLVSHLDPKITMNMEQLPLYLEMIEDVKKRYAKKIKIKVGIEADFLPGYESKTKAILNSYPFDYVYGSVHFIGKWGFDNPDERVRWKEEDINCVYHDYYDLLRRSAQSGLFDIMAHVDLVKKFGNRPAEDMAHEVRKTAEVFKDYGVAIEINSSGLRKPCKEIYPSLWNLRIYAQAGIPLIFGSDAHEPQHVGKDFDKSLKLAKDAGFKQYGIFEKRKIKKVIKL
ncbi:MAG: histidinol-phosphatase HisJ [Candidatus Omnitrophota bacterium]